MTNNRQAEYLIEFFSIGNAVKVSAVDPITGIEVSVMVPASLDKNSMQKLAVKKLEYMIEKHN